MRSDEGEAGSSNSVLAFNLRIPFMIGVGESFRREGCPAEVGSVATPGAPVGSPFGSRNPDPALIFESGPPSIVINGPAKRLVGKPGPSLVGVNPLAFGIGSPFGIPGGRRLPD